MAQQMAFELACPGVTFPPPTAGPVTCDAAMDAITGNQRCADLLDFNANVTASDCTACRTLFETAAAACDSPMVCN